MTNPGDPAFSSEWRKDANDEQMRKWIEEGYRVEGLTKREYFAALAMQGMLANPCYDDSTAIHIGIFAANNADALIAELNKEKP